MRILLVDDEIELTDPLSLALRQEQYDVDVACNGTEGYQMARAGAYDLFVLDWMLPEMTGLDLCQQLRSQGDLTPVLFLTAKDTLDDRVRGLDAGADDYLVKPFELRELLARVRALLRRVEVMRGSDRPSQVVDSQTVDSQTVDSQVEDLQVDDLHLDRRNQFAYRNGRTIDLSDKECKLLEFFMTQPGKLLAREEIYQHLWGGRDRPNSNVLPALIRLLRRKIEVDGESPLIHTVYGKGYRFGSGAAATP